MGQPCRDGQVGLVAAMLASRGVGEKPLERDSVTEILAAMPIRIP